MAITVFSSPLLHAVKEEELWKVVFKKGGIRHGPRRGEEKGGEAIYRDAHSETQHSSTVFTYCVVILFFIPWSLILTQF